MVEVRLIISSRNPTLIHYPVCFTDGPNMICSGGVLFQRGNLRNNALFPVVVFTTDWPAVMPAAVKSALLSMRTFGFAITMYGSLPRAMISEIILRSEFELTAVTSPESPERVSMTYR